MSNHPVAKFDVGTTVKIAIFRNETEKGVFFSANVEHQYKDKKDGNWKPSTNYNLNEMKALNNLSGQALAEMEKLQKAEGASVQDTSPPSAQEEAA